MIRVLLLCIACFFSDAAHSFKFEVESKLGKFSDPVHEILTLNSIQCYLEWEGELPQTCDLTKVDMESPFPTESLEISPQFTVDMTSLINSSSFPDDPGRTESFRGGSKSLVLDKNKCLVGSFKTFFLFKKDHTKNITGGLFCSSHFGVLQFFHSMASEEMMPYNFEIGRFEESETTESYSDSIAKILGWAKLTAKVSADDGYHILNEGIYKYFNSLPESDTIYPIAKYFAITKEYNYKGLEPFLSVTNKATGNPYQVKFIFNNICDSLVSYSNCKIVEDHEARIAALGSLFHLIQDSYSPSHTMRGIYKNNENVHAKINCKPIKQFSTYRGQDVKLHALADTPDSNNSITFDESCFDKSNSIHDPILAGAITLWHIINSDDLEQESLLKYLGKHVFSSPYIDATLAPLACDGNFKPDSGKCMAL